MLTVICLQLLINTAFVFTSVGEINPIPQTRQPMPCHFNLMKSAIRFCTLQADTDLLMAQSVSLCPEIQDLGGQ